MESNDCRMHYYGMFKKPDDRELLSHRARRYIRGIAVAMTLTFAALLFLAATLYGENRTTAMANPEPKPTQAAAPAQLSEPSALLRTDTR